MVSKKIAFGTTPNKFSELLRSYSRFLFPFWAGPITAASAPHSTRSSSSKSSPRVVDSGFRVIGRGSFRESQGLSL